MLIAPKQLMLWTLHLSQMFPANACWRLRDNRLYFAFVPLFQFSTLAWFHCFSTLHVVPYFRLAPCARLNWQFTVSFQAYVLNLIMVIVWYHSVLVRVCVEALMATTMEFEITTAEVVQTTAASTLAPTGKTHPHNVHSRAIAARKAVKSCLNVSVLCVELLTELQSLTVRILLCIRNTCRLLQTFMRYLVFWGALQYTPRLKVVAHLPLR